MSIVLRKSTTLKWKAFYLLAWLGTENVNFGATDWGVLMPLLPSYFVFVWEMLSVYNITLEKLVLKCMFLNVLHL